MNNEVVEENLPNNNNNNNPPNHIGSMDNLDVSYMILIKNPNNEIVLGIFILIYSII
jgi:hypothetical protein